jgi:serine/threonine protein kinase
MVYYELKILREVSHEYIMKLHEVYESETHLILILEYLRGGTLLQRVVKRRRFGEKECAIIIKKLILSLDYLHKKNIVHRDIKLENIFLIDDNETNIKLGDFDLACHFDKIDYSKQCGTPGYVAPEIFNPKVQYDYKVDIFSAGVVLYIM